MKRQLILSFGVMILAGRLAAGEAAPDPKEQLTAVFKKLGEASYNWTNTPRDGGAQSFMQGKPPPAEGVTGKDGVSYLKINSGKIIEAFTKGGKSVIKTDAGWKPAQQAADDAKNAKEAADEKRGASKGGGGGFGGMREPRDPVVSAARRLESFKTPAEEAQELISKIKDLKQATDGAIIGEFTEDGAAALLSFDFRDRSVAPTEAKGSAKFWLRGGAPARYEYHVQGKFKFGNFGSRDVSKGGSVDIKGIHNNNVNVPPEAAKHL